MAWRENCCGWWPAMGVVNSKVSCLHHSRTVGPLMCKEVVGACLRAEWWHRFGTWIFWGLETTLEAIHIPHEEVAARWGLLGGYLARNPVKRRVWDQGLELTWGLRLGTQQGHRCDVHAKLWEPRGECHSLCTLRNLLSYTGDGHDHSPIWILECP